MSLTSKTQLDVKYKGSINQHRVAHLVRQIYSRLRDMKYRLPYSQPQLTELMLQEQLAKFPGTVARRRDNAKVKDRRMYISIENHSWQQALLID